MSKIHLTVLIDAEVHSQLKIASVHKGRKMREIVQECIETYLHQCSQSAIKQ